MAMTDAEDWFIDTNVLVYASHTQSPWHAQAEAALRDAEASNAALWISDQILREYLATVPRPQPGHAAVPMSTAIGRVRLFAQRFDMAEAGPNARERLLSLLEGVRVAGRQVHDANIVAAMLANGITRLLTFNLGDFRRFSGLIAIETP